MRVHLASDVERQLVRDSIKQWKRDNHSEKFIKYVHFRSIKFDRQLERVDGIIVK